MNHYFNIRYELDKKRVAELIEKQIESKKTGYICVADGVILNTANRDSNYLKVINESLFSICDSSYVPLYLKWLYGIHVEQYCGSELFMDIIHCKKYRMFFMGTSQKILNSLQEKLSQIDKRINNMTFFELPYLNVNEFNYQDIAQMITDDDADIIWVALGAPKQEFFMSKLKPYLKKGLIIAVGAAFKFHSGTDERRAPQWMIKAHLEFVYRIFKNPRKQIKRCAWIICTLPRLLYSEWKRKKTHYHKEQL